MAVIRLCRIVAAATLVLSAVAFSGAPAVAASDKAKPAKRAPMAKPQISLPISKTAPRSDRGKKTVPSSEENQDYMVGEELC